MGGVGLIALGVGAYFGIRSKATYDDAVADHCQGDPNRCDADGLDGGETAHGQATASTVAFAAGGLLVAGGVVLYLTAPKGKTLAVQPNAGPSGAGFRLVGTF